MWDRVYAHKLEALLVIGIIPDLRHRETKITSDMEGFLKKSVRATIVFVYHCYTIQVVTFYFAHEVQIK